MSHPSFTWNCFISHYGRVPRHGTMLCILHLPTVLPEAEVWLSQHSNQAFTLDFRLCKLSHRCQMQLHLTEGCPATREEGTALQGLRAEHCEPSPLQAPQDPKRQQLQTALRGHTQTVQAPRLFSLGQKCQDLEDFLK